ncbi:MAG: hypothetical protein KF830_18650 [Planctomycetes bacterium]|nr:hypothetical protein [Planctomycetota bacterium]
MRPPACPAASRTPPPVLAGRRSRGGQHRQGCPPGSRYPDSRWGQDRIGFYGPILGQEAATIGSVAALEPRDWIFPALREGAAAMMRGLSLTSAIDQLVGNGQDRCKGRQMPCHSTFKEGHFYGMSSVIGTQISHAVGAAMAARIRDDDTVVLG